MSSRLLTPTSSMRMSIVIVQPLVRCESCHLYDGHRPANSSPGYDRTMHDDDPMSWTKTLSVRGRTSVLLPRYSRTGKVKVVVRYRGDEAVEATRRG
jgi:hypothetical protein